MIRLRFGRLRNPFVSYAGTGICKRRKGKLTLSSPKKKKQDNNVISTKHLNKHEARARQKREYQRENQNSVGQSRNTVVTVTTNTHQARDNHVTLM